ncbi:MAG TPA: iron chelate uptake ABC transporter family permease subunit [Candidatus Dormibacteraeota bacterium]|nr:iron chelate uptake ABC transporter family permease subunit [Candidatus Dormibacteraeota bacterium]
MIGEFIDSWPLFHNAYLAGWLIGVLLAFVGVVVVARSQIFIGAAVAQSSTLGIALGMWVGSRLGAETLSGDHAHGLLSLIGIVFAVAAAVFTARGGAGGAREAATGWVFLAAASLSIVVLSHSPHGLEEINHLVSSSIIGARDIDVWVFGALVLISAGAVAALRDRLILFAIDAEMAAAVGMRTGVWNIGLAVWLGLVVGGAMRAAGLLYTFGSLVLPALAATALCRETRSLFVVAPLLALLAGVVGFVLANHSDDPPGQMAVVVQAVMVAAAWGVRRWRR